MRKPMRATAELLGLDQPVQSVVPTGLTAQTCLTGLTAQIAENGDSAINSELKGKAEVIFFLMSTP